MASPSANDTPLPRQFVAEAPPQALEAPDSDALRQVLDVFQTRHGGNVRDWAVCRQTNGQLRLVPLSSGAFLPADLQAQIAAGEMLNRPRVLEWRELFLMAIDFLDQMPDTPGFNDPLQLVGTLYGPFDLAGAPGAEPYVAQPPSAGGGTQARAPVPHRSGVAQAVGKLTVTRGDILQGIVSAHGQAYQTVDGDAPVHSRCYHLLLPGGPENVLLDGRSAVLAYVLPPGSETRDNSAATVGLLYDVLVALQTDFRQKNCRGAFPELKLPPRKLADASAPRVPPRENWLARLFSGIWRKGKRLPPVGSFPDFLRIARLALAHLPEWPTSRAQIVRAKTRLTEAFWSVECEQGLTLVPTPKLRFEDDALVSPKAQNRVSGNFVFKAEAELLHCGKVCDADVQLEYFDDAGTIGLYCRPAHAKECQRSGAIELSGSRTWKTANLRVENLVLNQSTKGGDLDFYFVCNNDVSIRRVLLRTADPQRTAAALQSQPQSKDRISLAGPWKGQMFRVYNDAEQAAVADDGISPAARNALRADFDDRAWNILPVPAPWSSYPEPWPAINGEAVFRKEIEVPKSWLGRDLALSLGPIDDFDATFFNGVQIGTSAGHTTHRLYLVPARLVQTERNCLAVRVFDGTGEGGIKGDPQALFIAPAPDGFSSGLIGWWRLDEKSGSVARDSSLFGNDGGIDGAQWARDGDGLLLRGLGDRVVVPYAPQFNLEYDLSLAFWLYSESYPSQAKCHILGRGETAERETLAFWLEKTQLVLRQRNHAARRIWVNSESPIQPGYWVQVAGVIQGQEARLYFNGELEHTAKRLGRALWTNAPLILGYPGYGGVNLRARLKDVRLFARALDEQEVLALAEKSRG